MRGPRWFKIALGHGETEDRHTANNGSFSSFSIFLFLCVLYANRSSTLPLVVLRFLSSSDTLERPTQNDRTRSVTFLKASARAKKFASKIGPHVFSYFLIVVIPASPLVFHTQRKTGLFKKAYELGVLCSVDVAVIIFGIVHLSPLSPIFHSHALLQSANLAIQISFSNIAQPT
jgi:SRF-type transcription factor (DNA-binding and dimerisation domain)